MCLVYACGCVVVTPSSLLWVSCKPTSWVNAVPCHNTKQVHANNRGLKTCARGKTSYDLSNLKYARRSPTSFDAMPMNEWQHTHFVFFLLFFANQPGFFCSLRDPWTADHDRKSLSSTSPLLANDSREIKAGSAHTPLIYLAAYICFPKKKKEGKGFIASDEPSSAGQKTKANRPPAPRVDENSGGGALRLRKLANYHVSGFNIRRPLTPFIGHQGRPHPGWDMVVPSECTRSPPVWPPIFTQGKNLGSGKKTRHIWHHLRILSERQTKWVGEAPTNVEETVEVGGGTRNPGKIPNKHRNSGSWSNGWGLGGLSKQLVRQLILSGTQDAEISERVSCDIRCKTQPKEYTPHIGWLKTHSDQEGG